MASASTTLVGNVTADPELRFTAGGTARASFSIACDYNWKKDNGEWDKRTSFFRVVAWGDLAEYFAEVVTKGQRLVVTGRLEQRSWDDQEKGKQSITEMVADDIGVSIKGITATKPRAKKEYANAGASSNGSNGGTTATRPAANTANNAPFPDEPAW